MPAVGNRRVLYTRVFSNAVYGNLFFFLLVPLFPSQFHELLTYWLVWYT